MDIDKAEIYNAIKMRDKKSEFEEPDIVSAVDEVEQVIKNYCAIPSVPIALRYTVVNMSIDLLRYWKEMAKETASLGAEDLDISDISNIKVGDTDINLGGSRQDSLRKTVLKSHKLNLDAIVMNYTLQLNQFRRLW